MTHARHHPLHSLDGRGMVVEAQDSADAAHESSNYLRITEKSIRRGGANKETIGVEVEQDRYQMKSLMGQPVADLHGLDRALARTGA